MLKKKSSYSQLPLTQPCVTVNILAMDIATYRQKQAEAQARLLANRRIPCQKCLQPDFSCYCEINKPFDPGMSFIILIHPVEVAKRIATGRMAHLNLKNSHIFGGHDFTNNVNVNVILADKNRHCMMLYPGPQSANLSLMSADQKTSINPSEKKLTIFVIDGTWHTAKKMVNVSENLRQMPRICFTPDKPSAFRVRKQPRPECYSTIEAIHQTIDLLSPQNRKHDHLLYVFNKMVARQIELSHSQKWSSWDELAI